jgi:hypothetical protein
MERARQHEKTDPIHRGLKRNIRNKVRWMKKKKIEEMRNKIENWRKTDQRTLWNELKKMAKWDKERTGLPKEMIDSEGTRVTEDRERMEVWREAWSTLGEEDMEDEKFDKTFAERLIKEMRDGDVEDGWEGDRAEERARDEMGRPIELREVKEKCRKIQNAKQPGDDQMIGELFKYGGERVVFCLWIICREVWEREEMPKDWSRGVVVPLFKGKGRQAQPAQLQRHHATQHSR